MPNVSRSKKSSALVLAAWLLVFAVSAYVLRDRLLSDALALLVWILVVVGLMFPISAIANRLNQRHDEWLRTHGLHVNALVVACFVPGRTEPDPYEAATHTVIALGTHPVTQQKTQFHFYTNFPLRFRYGTPVQIRVNPGNAADYMCDSSDAL